MKIERIEHELFLLMLNLSQIEETDLIKSKFIETLNSIIDHVQLSLVDDKEVSFGKVIAIATPKNRFGSLVLQGDMDAVSTDLLVLLENASRMFAVILEKHWAEKLLNNEKIMLQEMVLERTRELEITNLELRQEIEERRQAEIALKRSERKWRNVLINTPQIGITLNPEAEIVFANEHFLKLKLRCDIPSDAPWLRTQGIPHEYRRNQKPLP